MSKTSTSRTFPRAIIHKKILDAAAEKPNASMGRLASEIPSATTELVERVLDEYGDPGAEEPDTSNPPTSGATSSPTADESSPDRAINQATTEDSTIVTGATQIDTGQKSVEQEDTESDSDKAVHSEEKTYPAVNDLSAKQREVLRAIYEHPTASQRELADVLDVSGPTICNRANSIEKFSWENREKFATAVFEKVTVPHEEKDASIPTSDTVPVKQRDADMATNDNSIRSDVKQLENRLDALEQRLEDSTDTERSGLCITDPELTRKIIHACFNSDMISEEEEIKLLDHLSVD